MRSFVVPSGWRAATRIRPVDTAWPFALRAGLAVALPMVVLVAAGHTPWAGIATFGAFTALYGRDEPYPRRARITAAAGAGLVAAVAAGGLALLVGELGQPTPPPDLIGDRVVQTVLGCSLGLVAAALVRNRAATRHLEATVEALERSALTVSRAAAGVSTLEDAPQRKEIVMTSTPGLPPVGLLLGIDNDENDGADNGPVVGASDAEADAAASGAPADLEHPTHDSDGVPVGQADLDEDRRSSGA